MIATPCGQRDVICKIYDYAESVPITGPLAAYLTLLHTCGPEALRGGDDQQLKFETDIFTAWAATGPDLRAVLKRDGELIICPELGTRYPAAA